MPPSKNDLLQGTLDLLILQVLYLEPMHGWGISERIQQMSDDTFQVNQGSLYPALQRLKRKGYVTAEWRVTMNNRRARYYTLTMTNRKGVKTILQFQMIRINEEAPDDKYFTKGYLLRGR